MTFPTVDECVGSDGPKRELLHEFDHLLRDLLNATRRKARKLDIDDREMESACVTVMMSVIAGAALSSAPGAVEVTDAHFSEVARDAFFWAQRRLGPRRPL